MEVSDPVAEQPTGSLGQANSETEHLLASIAWILIAVDERGAVTRWNAAAEAAFAMPAAAVLGRPLRETGIAWDWRAMLDRIALARASDTPTRFDDVAYRRVDGGEGYLGITLATIRAGRGQPAGILLLGADTTERRLLEAQLAQAQKLESIGQLAAGVAHELNTPIQFIGDNVRFMQGAFAELSELLESYRALRAAAEGHVDASLVDAVARREAAAATRDDDAVVFRDEALGRRPLPGALRRRRGRQARGDPDLRDGDRPRVHLLRSVAAGRVRRSRAGGAVTTPSLRVVFVDDEPYVLQALSRLLRPMRAEWHMEFASSAAAALEILAQGPFDAVVTDMRMPGMDGAELLDEVKRRHPHVVRIVLSGQADQASVLRSLGSTHQYLSKPCDPETLKQTLVRACAVRMLLADDALKQVVSQLGSLPSLPDDLRGPPRGVPRTGRLRPQGRGRDQPGHGD